MKVERDVSSKPFLFFVCLLCLVFEAAMEISMMAKNNGNLEF
jgi:hypothetical protein